MKTVISNPRKDRAESSQQTHTDLLVEACGRLCRESATNAYMTALKALMNYEQTPRESYEYGPAHEVLYEDLLKAKRSL